MIILQGFVRSFAHIIPLTRSCTSLLVAMSKKNDLYYHSHPCTIHLVLWPRCLLTLCTTIVHCLALATDRKGRAHGLLSFVTMATESVQCGLHDWRALSFPGRVAKLRGLFTTLGLLTAQHGSASRFCSIQVSMDKGNNLARVQGHTLATGQTLQGGSFFFRDER